MPSLTEEQATVLRFKPLVAAEVIELDALASTQPDFRIMPA